MTKITTTKLFSRAIFRNKFFRSNKDEDVFVQDRVILGFHPATPNNPYRSRKYTQVSPTRLIVRDTAPYKIVHQEVKTKSRAGVEYSKFKEVLQKV